MMQRCVGIVRNAEDLQKGLEELEELREEAKTVKAHASAKYS
jgi:succinate dehydrogenase/fumarate reductase flavoprotein subunit